MITVVILAVISLVDVAGTITVRILVLPLMVGIIVDVIVIVAGAVMTVVGTVVPSFSQMARTSVLIQRVRVQENRREQTRDLHETENRERALRFLRGGVRGGVREVGRGAGCGDDVAALEVEEVGGVPHPEGLAQERDDIPDINP